MKYFLPTAQYIFTWIWGIIHTNISQANIHPFAETLRLGIACKWTQRSSFRLENRFKTWGFYHIRFHLFFIYKPSRKKKACRNKNKIYFQILSECFQAGPKKVKTVQKRKMDEKSNDSIGGSLKIFLQMMFWFHHFLLKGCTEFVPHDS